MFNFHGLCFLFLALLHPVTAHSQITQPPLAKKTSTQGALATIESGLLSDPAQWGVPFYPLGLLDPVTDFKVMGDSILVIGRIGSRADSTRMWGIALWDGRKWSSPVTRPAGLFGRFTTFVLEGNEIFLMGMGSRVEADKGMGLLAKWDGRSWDNRRLSYGSPAFSGIFFTKSLVKWNGQLTFGSLAEGIWIWGDTVAVPLPGTTDGDGMRINGLDIKGSKLWAWGDIRGRGIGSFDGATWTYPTLSTRTGLSLAWLGETGFFLNNESHDSFDFLDDSTQVTLLKIEGATWSKIPLDSTMHNPRFLASDGEVLYLVGFGPKKRFASGDQYVGLWIARWSGQNFQVMERADFQGQLTKVKADRGRLFFGGEFSRIGGIRADNLAMWDGSKWHAFTQSIHPGLAGYTTAAVSWDAKLVFGGKALSYAGSQPASPIATWDGKEWNGLGKGLRMDHNRKTYPDDPIVNQLATDNGKLYAGGLFDSAGTKAAANIASWDGKEWSSLGEGRPEEVLDLLVMDGNLYTYHYASAVPGTTSGIPEISKWDGRQWISLGVSNLQVYPNAITTFRGAFLASAGGEIVRWVGDVRDTLNCGLSGRVGRIHSHQNDLYIAGVQNPTGLYKFNGVSLDTLPGVDNVQSMLSDGENLFVEGRILIPGYPDIGLARWNGHSWLPLVEYPISLASMAVHNEYLYLFLSGPISFDNPNFDYYLRWNRQTGSWSRPHTRKPADGRQAWKAIPCAQGCVLNQKTSGLWDAYDMKGRSSSGSKGIRRRAAGVSVIKKTQ